MKKAADNTTRLPVQMTAEQRDIIERAAELEGMGRSISAWVLQQALRRAREIVNSPPERVVIDGETADLVRTLAARLTDTRADRGG